MSLHDVHGRLPYGSPDGHHWYLGQGELIHPPDYPRDLWIHYSIGLLELDNGNWISRPEHHTKRADSFTVKAYQHPTREAALRAAVAEVVRMIRKAARKGRGGIAGLDFLKADVAERTIRWAFGLLDLNPPTCRLLPLSTFRAEERPGLEIPAQGVLAL